MGQVTLNYGRLHRLVLESVINMLHKPEFVPLYRCLARMTPTQYRHLTGDMGSTSQEGV